jgi:homogentisate 1,2-dioxygenase
MTYYRRVGEVPRKRHTQHRRPDGGLHYEELVGQQGFSSDSSLLYHHRIPAAIVDAQPWEPGDLAVTANHPLRPRHLHLHALFPGEEWKRHDVVTGRRLVLANADVRISYVAAGEVSPLYRNATGDELVYVEAGAARLETAFGALDLAAGDYVVIPGSATHRWVPVGDDPLRCYVIEANSHVMPPRRYRSDAGQFLEGAPYCERDLRGPTEPLVVDERDVTVHLKHLAADGSTVTGTTLTYEHHPFDVVAWDGCCYPYALNIHDFEPLTGRIHQPPPTHQVFEAKGFVVCNFVPRRVDDHPQAVPIPYYHSNVDSDEAIFYCGGDYAARAGSGIGPGSVSLHPAGHPHGPQPGAPERSLGLEWVDELAVMVDTFRPLGVGEGGEAGDDAHYAWTWSGHHPTP